MHWLQRKKTRTHFNGPFLKKWDLTVKKVQQNLNLFTVFSWFFPKWYLKQSKFLHHCTQWIKTLHISLQTPYEHEQFKKKSGKTTIRVQFCWTFSMVKSYFFKNGPSKWVLFFALQSVHQDASFELSNGTIWWFSIFTLVRRGPFWFRGGLSATPRGWTGQKWFSKCFSWTLWHSPCI